MLVSVAMSVQVRGHIPGLPVDETLKHLDGILCSPAFSSSKRCQEFLRFVVIETIEGRADSLKERTIALGVFNKGDNFEPGEDSLVRVKAREVRKRLAEYYQSAPESMLVIELPLGGYVPRIELTVQPAAPAARPPDSIAQAQTGVDQPRRRLLWWLAGSLAAAGSAPLLLRLRPGASPLESLWRPIFATGVPLLIFIPVLSDQGGLTDRVGLGTTAVVSRAVNYLTERHYPYHLRFGQDLTFSQLREQPSLLLGGFSSQWTERMTKGLRFQLMRGGAANDGASGGMVVDTQGTRRWGPIHTVNGYADQDYAILCRLFDSNNGQIVLIAAGVTTFGTESAAEYLFSQELFSQVAAQGPKDWETKSFQAVVHLSIIGTTPTSSQLIATHFW